MHGLLQDVHCRPVRPESPGVNTKDTKVTKEAKLILSAVLYLSPRAERQHSLRSLEYDTAGAEEFLRGLRILRVHPCFLHFELPGFINQSMLTS